jgi:hypothetical protein
MLKTDIRIQGGVPSEAQGAGDPNIDSATASANVDKGFQVRNSDRGDRVRKAYLDLSKGLWMILQQFPNERRSRRIAGPVAGQFTTLTYTLEELRGEFAFDMDFGAMINDNPATRTTRAILNYNLLRQDPRINPDMLILDVLKAQNKPNPQAYMLELREPRQELAMIMQALPVEAHERDDHERHMQEHDQQLQQLMQGLAGLDPRSQDGERIRMMQMLLLSHMNDHARKLQSIVSSTSRTRPGRPVAENLLRNQVRAGSSETEAELSGQPLTPEGLVQ